MNRAWKVRYRFLHGLLAEGVAEDVLNAERYGSPVPPSAGAAGPGSRSRCPPAACASAGSRAKLVGLGLLRWVASRDGCYLVVPPNCVPVGFHGHFTSAVVCTSGSALPEAFGHGSSVVAQVHLRR